MENSVKVKIGGMNGDVSESRSLQTAGGEWNSDARSIWLGKRVSAFSNEDVRAPPTLFMHVLLSSTMLQRLSNTCTEPEPGSLHEHTVVDLIMSQQ